VGGNPPPNILIILDTSATMGNSNLLVHSSSYDPNTTYTATKIGSVTPKKGTVYYSKNVFKETEKMLLVEVTSGIDNDATNKIICQQARNQLINAGTFVGKLATTPNSDGKFDCTSTISMVFYNGNYLNYLSSTTTAGDATSLRQTVARNAIKQLVDTTDSSVARYGLMGFDNNKDDGGNVVLHVGATAAQFDTLLNDTSPSNPIASAGTTPIGEALAEAGLYYAGKSHWSHYQ